MIFRRYLTLAKAHRRLLGIGMLSGLVAGIASGFGVPFFVQHVFRNIFENTGEQYTTLYLVLVASLLPLVFLIRGLAGYANQYFLQWGMQNILQDVRQGLFDKLQILPVAYFERRQSGDLMAKLVGDTLQVQQAVYLVAREAFVQPFTLIAGLGYLVFLTVTQRQIGFLLVLVVLAPLMILPIRYIGRNLRKRSAQLQATLGELTEIMAENLRGVVEVRSFNMEAAQAERFRAKLLDYNRFAMKMAKYYHLTQPFMEWLAVLMVSAAFIYSYRTGVGFSAFAAVGAALFFTIDAAKRLLKMVNEVQRNHGSFERIEQVLTEPDTLPDVAAPVQMAAVRGDLTFRGVQFGYGGEVAKPDLVIPELVVPHGSTVALVGPSGAGKSTFAKLLPRFYDPQQGSIELDGVDLRRLSKRQLRQQIAFVPQTPVLFAGTVRENLLMGAPQASETELIQAATAAHAMEFIERLPQGLDTPIGENAVLLSGGQRQRLALARAFLKNAPILILDEATSALDAASEEAIQAALAELARGRTVFIIAHRFATVRIARRILLFDGGQIRADGSFEELLRDPLFRRLHDMQAGGAAPVAES